MGNRPVLNIFAAQQFELSLCSNPLANVNLEQMDLVDSHHLEAHGDPLLMARLAEVTYATVGCEEVRVPFDLWVEAEAFGSAIKPISKDHSPSAFRPTFETVDQLHDCKESV